MRNFFFSFFFFFDFFPPQRSSQSGKLPLTFFFAKFRLKAPKTAAQGAQVSFYSNYLFSPVITRTHTVRCKKVKKKKIFLRDVFSRGFPISGNKKGGKSKWFSFLRSGERENGKKLFKKKFSLLGSFFTTFGRKFAGKDNWKVFRGKGKGVESKKKSNLKKKVLSAFFRYFRLEKRSVSEWVCVCSRDHGRKKITYNK